MKKYIYYIILFPLFIFANPVVDYNNCISHNLDKFGNYPNYNINITQADLYTGSGGGSGTISVTNNVLTVYFSGGWVQQPLKTGVIKVLTISPALPDIELGPVTTSATNYSNAYNAKIENNSLVIYSTADVLNGVSTSIVTSPSNYAAGVDYTASLPSLFNCTTSEGISSGTITIKSGIVTLNMSGSWPSKCSLKTGSIMYLNTGAPLQNIELGIIKQGSNDTNYRARITSNYLVFYSTGASPPLTTSASLNVSKDLNEGFELLIPNDYSNNWIHNVSYDPKGNVISQSRSYFNDLGKGDVSLFNDYVTDKIWGTETTYDDLGRADKTSFIAPSPLNTFEKTNFLKSSSEAASSSSPPTVSLNNITSSGNYKASQSINVTGTVSSGLNISLTAPIITLSSSNNFTITATSGSSFVVTAANLPDASANPSLANYYSDSNTDEPYQATATHPFAQTNYDPLNPGNVINIVGGNKINGVWKTGYTYTVPAAQEMYYVYGSDYYDGAISGGREEVITKFYKSVSVDANGNENVAFTDGEGKLLATARSGVSTVYPVVSLIGTQGFVDVHIPVGITSGISLIGGASLYKIYDLKTGLITSGLTGGNAYRIEAITPPASDPKTYIAGGQPTYDSGALGITYNVNYSDYAVNVYNKTGQLIKAIQPNGYTSNTTIVANPSHMTSPNFATTYKYNGLNQLIEISNSDEGISKFAYRNDGQIRYSQSSLQADTKVSYTDYDELGRPKESGIITGSNGIWASASANPDSDLQNVSRSEQTFTIYDYPENNATSVALPTNLTLASVLATAGISSTNYTQNNLSRNVAVTYTKPGTNISAITWYSYDLYERVEWIVQYNEGIGAKTIHYEYDYKGNVKKVLFQKDKAAELFVHRYTYNVNDVLTKVETSTDNTTFTTHADYNYYKTGELKRINIAQGAQGLDYVYTLGGKLKSINHPSLEASKDPGGDSNDVFGLTLDYYNGDYLRTGRNIISSPSAGSDYNGNIKAARWTNKNVPSDGGSNQKGYLYTYDRNNWLTSATFGNTDPSTTIISPVVKLAEKGITYDANGNIQTLQRTNELGNTVDNLAYSYTNTGKNQLTRVNDTAPFAGNATDIQNGQNNDNYRYNAIGQLEQNIQENLNYRYNSQGLVIEVNKGSNKPLVRFFYNERGQRIKTESYNNATFVLQNTTYNILDISGNTMAIYNLSSGNNIVQADLPIFGLNRLGVYNRITQVSNYEITDHLGNVRAVIPSNSQAQSSFADYYPFGELLPNRNSLNYRYAFQGQELDKDTGMEAFQLRLWDGRIGRWLSPDPYRQYASPYLGMGNNPISGIDSDGGFWQELKNWVFGSGWISNAGKDKLNSEGITDYISRFSETPTDSKGFHTVSYSKDGEVFFRKFKNVDDLRFEDAIGFKVTMGAQAGFDISKTVSLDVKLFSVKMLEWDAYKGWYNISTSNESSMDFLNFKVAWMGASAEAGFTVAGPKNKGLAAQDFSGKVQGGYTSLLQAGYDFNTDDPLNNGFYTQHGVALGGGAIIEVEFYCHSKMHYGAQIEKK